VKVNWNVKKEGPSFGEIIVLLFIIFNLKKKFENEREAEAAVVVRKEKLKPNKITLTFRLLSFPFSALSPSSNILCVVLS